MTQGAIQMADSTEAATGASLTDAAVTLAERVGTLLQDGRVNVARLLVPALLRMAGGSPEAHLLAAEVALADDDYTKAAGEAAEAVIAEPNNAKAKAVLGRSLLGLGRRREAGSCLVEAWHEGFQDEPTLLALADVAPAAALEPLFAGLSESPGAGRLYQALTRALLELHETEAAKSICDIAMAAGVTDVPNRLLAMEAATQGGDWDAAREICQALDAKLSPVNA